MIWCVCGCIIVKRKQEQSRGSVPEVVIKLLFYKAFMRFSILFEISLKHTLEGFAVAEVFAEYCENGRCVKA